MTPLEHNQSKYISLREKYPVFHFDHFIYTINQNDIHVQYFYHSEEIVFNPTIKIQFGKYLSQNIFPESIEGFLFNIGLIELISYWKCVASPIVEIHPFTLNKEQENWWKKLYYNGLGEYFYQNTITSSQNDFLNFQYDQNAKPYSSLLFEPISNSNRVIIPIGGGKDSVVTLEHFLYNQKDVIPFIINPRGATLDCAKVAGFETLHDIFVIHREIDPLLIQLNQKGYLNGHTPFSAMLAFYTALVGFITNTREIALSNEASANEATIPGTDINHQYSKSLEFEQDFQKYVQKYMNDSVHYFSFLRPLSELEIAEKFAQYKQYHPVFKSCNAGSKENKWCCNCPKCLFAYIILSPYLSTNELVDIFGEDLLNKPSLNPYFEELTGIADVKPFECVGTIEEVNEAIRMIIPYQKDKYLIQNYITKTNNK